MNKDKLSQDIKTVLDASEPAHKIKQQLHSRRVQVLDQVETNGNWWFPNWLLPTASMATVLMAVVLIISNGQNEFSQMAELSAEDLEIMLTMDIEDIEELEFYEWLDSEEDLTG